MDVSEKSTSFYWTKIFLRWKEDLKNAFDSCQHLNRFILGKIDLLENVLW